MPGIETSSKHDVKGASPVGFKTFFASLREIDSMPFSGEQSLQHFAHDLFVIDDEDRAFLGVAPLGFHFGAGLHGGLWWSSVAIWLLKRKRRLLIADCRLVFGSSIESLPFYSLLVALKGLAQEVDDHRKLTIGNGFSVADGLKTSAVQGGGKRDAKSGALTRRAINIDMTRMLLNDSVRNCQPKTGATSHTLSGVKRIVDLCDILRRDTNTSICHLNNQGTVVESSG